MPKKRKADALMQKFYAVRAGHTPGIYYTWQECQPQITGFRGAQYKAFETMEDAAAFVAGKTPPSELASKGKAKQPDKFYAVAKGRKPGIYTDWDTAQTEAIIGTKGPKYKKFGTLAEAQQYIRLNGSLETIQRLGLLPDVDEDANDEEVSAAPAAKKAKTKTEDSEAEVKIVLPPKASATGLEDGVLHIHTDGSSLDNGSVVARAGVGVFFGHNDPRNIAEKLEGELQTNQRAELTAVLRALQVAPVNQDVQITSDSKYTINCASVWYKNWERNGWRSSKGDAVLNQDLIKAIRAKIEERNGQKAKTIFKWVKGHAKDPGNIAADALAVMAAKGL